ncbi:MAG TPA: MFS transporter [Blastocatellia bacterium]|nr:MFS transporter [Blastocatellia bacterium]
MHRNGSHKHSLILVALAYASFISLGLPDGLNGVAWPSIRAGFNLPIDALGSLLVMFTAGYLLSSFSSGQLLARMSVGALLALSCLATATSLVGYAFAPAWRVMVGLGLLSGMGAGAIDAGLNTFAATRFSARTVNWLHACYGVGAASGPVIMTRVLASHHPWQRGYVIVGTWQLLLAVSFTFTRKLWSKTDTDARSLGTNSATRATSLSTLRVPIVRLSIAVFFVYTGIEASAGTWAFSLFTEGRGISLMTSGTWVSIYWGSLTAGRLAAGFAAGFLSVQRLLSASLLGVALGATMLWLGGASIFSFVGLGFMGFACAPVFPSMIAATPARVGVTHTSNAVGFQIAAAVLGQSLFPALIGVMARRLGLEIVGVALAFSAVVLIGLHLSLTSAGSRAARAIGNRLIETSDRNVK